MSIDHTRIQSFAAKHPVPENRRFAYGTAGFRMKAEVLDGVVFRVGLLAALRSCNTGRAIGVMITASHNPVHDNGVKIVDPKGEMLTAEWEKHAASLANSVNGGEAAELEKVLNETNTSLTTEPIVFIGCDTRPSSAGLVRALNDGLSAVSACVKDCGVVTTPQLHYMVYAHNVLGMKEPSQASYYEMLASGYRKLVKETSAPRKIVIDAADGVGGVKAEEFARLAADCLDIKVVNNGESGTSLLNDGCGAEFVQKQKHAPRNITFENVGEQPVASFDGDADRIVYMYFDKEGQFHLVDGDKEATLIAKFVKDHLATVKAATQHCDLTVGVVQTAYANGSSTKYLRDEIGVDVSIVPTGVKHLHHKALEYDVGIYFEANGHGTVVFSDNYGKQLQDVRGKVTNEAADSVETLLCLPQLINQAVGDALSDMLAIEGILYRLGWSVPRWNALYNDMPSRMTKVYVKDRTVIKTVWNETQVLHPEGLQDKIDELTAQFSGSRAFVRPSGTEDVVRVYAEASTADHTNQLAQQVSAAVFDMADGVGDRPSI